MASDGALAEQSYYSLCPDSELQFVVTMTATKPDQVLPPSLQLPCLAASCTLGEHVLLPVTKEDVAELLTDEEDEEDEDEEWVWGGGNSPPSRLGGYR